MKMLRSLTIKDDFIVQSSLFLMSAVRSCKEGIQGVRGLQWFWFLDRDTSLSFAKKTKRWLVPEERAWLRPGLGSAPQLLGALAMWPWAGALSSPLHIPLVENHQLKGAFSF